MSDFSKKEKRALRELVGQAYRAELSAELDKLLAEFQRWKAGEIEPGDLAHAIHQFHDGPNRKLYSLYNTQDLRLLVARALALRHLDISAIPPALLPDLQPIIDFARDHFE